MVKMMLGVVVAGLLAGCATPYGPSGMAGGYSETARGSNLYVVRFEGNGYTSSTKAEEMAFLRAAELTLEKGFFTFSIYDESTNVSTSTMYTPTQSTTTGSISPSGQFQARTVTTGGNAVDVSRPVTRLFVVLGGADWLPKFDAKDVVAELGKKYKK